MQNKRIWYKKARLTISRSGICPECGRNWVGLVGSCTCGYCGRLIEDE